jgi:acyl carrier protein
VNPDSLNETSGPLTVSAWDSLGTMMLLAAIEEEFGIRLSVSLAVRIKSIADLRIALRGKAAEL